MKRTLLVLAALLCTATTVSANYKAQKTDNKLIITNTNDTNALLILSGYDENGLLKGAQLLKAEDGKYTANEIENASSYRIADSDGFWDVNFITPTPQSTPLPTITPKPTIHPAYEKEKDAIFTIAVVKNISTITYDGDNAYKIDAFTRGTEESFIIPCDAPILKAPDYFKGLEGNDASCLKMGDIVYIPVGLNQKTKNFALVHRPLNKDIITSSEDFGENFEKLISSNGVVYGSPNTEPGAVIPYGGKISSSRYNYAFGVITDKYDSGFTLRNKSGKFDTAIEVELSDNTIVYVCDMEGKGSVSIGRLPSIIKSSIPNVAYDDNENITFSSDYSYNYAFARIVDNIATEVVIYTNYDE